MLAQHEHPTKPLHAVSQRASSSPATQLTRPDTVTEELTPERLRRQVENDEYAAFIRRILRACSRRVGGGDVEALALMLGLAEEIDTAIAEAVKGLRAHGYSWAEIGARLGITPAGRTTKTGNIVVIMRYGSRAVSVQLAISSGGWSRGVKIWAGAGRGGLGALPRGAGVCAAVRGGDGRGGLPVTPAHLGMRTRQLAWRWGLDLRVAQCCLEHAGQYSGPGARRPGPPGSPLLPITPSIGGSGEQTAGHRRPGTRAGP
jgi:hypothetical protein